MSEAIDSVVKSLDDMGMLYTVSAGLFAGGGNLLKSLAGFGNQKNSTYQIRQVGDAIQLVQTQAQASTSVFTGMWKAFNSGTTITQKVSGGFKALGKNIAKSVLPNLTSMAVAGAKGIAIALAFKGVGWIIDNTVKKYDNLEKEIQDRIKTTEGEIEALNKQKKSMEEIASEYDELSKKSKKSEEESIRLSELKQEIATLMPELVGGYDANNDPILLMTGSAQELVKELEKAVAEKQELLKIEYSKDADVASKQIEKTKKDLDELNEKLGKISQGNKTGNIIDAVLNDDGIDTSSLRESWETQSKEYDKYLQKQREKLAQYREDEMRMQQETMSHLFDTSLYKGIEDDKLKQQINSWSSLFDWGDFTNSAERKHMIEELSKVMANGSLDVEKWGKSWEEANERFKLTGNEKEYTKNLQSLAKELENLTGISASQWMKGLTQEIDALSEKDIKLNKFLESLGSSRFELSKGDSFAINLKKQFDDLSNFLDYATIDGEIPVELYTKINEGKIYQELPQQIKDIIAQALKSDGISETEHEVITALSMSISNGGMFTEDVAEKISRLLKGGLKENEINVPLKINDETTLNPETLNKLNDYFRENPLNVDLNGKVSKINIDDKELEEKLSVLGDKKELKAQFKAEVIGLDELDYYAEIVKNLPADSTHTENFIVDNQEALSNLNSYKEVKEWIIAHPEVISKYKLNVEKDPELKKALEEFEKNNGKTSTVKVKGEEEGVTETKEKVDELKEEASKDIKLTVNNGELQGSVESFEKLVEYSSKIKDGEYKLSFTSDTGESITQINNLKDAVNKLSTEFSSLPSITVKIETTLASKNVTGLRNNIEKFNSLAGGLKTLTFSTDTARGSKNVTGLRNNVSNYASKYGGQTIKTTFSTDTARASQNVTGLRRNVDSYVKSYGGQTIKTTFKIVTEKVTKTTTVASSTNKNNSSNKGDTFALQRSVDNVSVASEPTQVDTAPVTREGASPQDTGATARVSTTPTLQTPIAITGGDIYNSMKYDVNLLKELENRIEKVSNALSTLDKKMEDAVGNEKIEYLKKQNILYQEQINLQKELEDKLIRIKNQNKAYLEGKGFKFNADDNITNYEEKILLMEEELEKLEKIAEAKQKAYNSYSGDNDKEKDKLSKAYDTAKDEADAYAKSLAEIQKYAENYFDVTFTELPKVREEYVELENSINDNTEAIKNLAREQALFTKNSKIRELDMLLDEVNDKQELLNEQMSRLDGDEKVKYQEEYIKLLEREAELQEERIKQYKASLSVYQKELSSFGMEFDVNGTVQNLDEVLNKYQHHKDLEYLNNLIEEYFDIQRDALPDAKRDWQSIKNEIAETKDEIAESAEAVKKFQDEIKNLATDSGYKSHNRDLYEVENALAMNQIHLNNSTGQNYIEYLEQRIELTHKLRKETQDLLDFENSRRSTLMSDLSKYGFEFRNDGSIVHYGSKIQALKESLSEEEFEKVFGMIEDYLDTTYDKIPELQESLQELGYSIEDYSDELEKLLRQRALDIHLNKLKELENEYDKLCDTLSIVDIKLKHAVGKEKLDLLDEQIQLLEEQKDKQLEFLQQYENMARIYQRDLSGFGVRFDENGDILNLDEVLDEYKDHRDIEKLKELIDEYLDVQRDKIPDIRKEWESLGSAIKDAYKDQLSTAKKIEDEITSMYKKQIQDRIKAMNEETDAKVKALKKQKDAYNEYRDEVDYKNEYNEKLDEINDLQKQLDIAMRDTSLHGQQKVKELQKLLAEAQKELDKFTQNKIDSDVNDLFDKEMDRIEEENEQAVEKFEEEWSDSKIAEMVAQALGSGVFTDIEGNVHDLEDALIDFAKETGELFGVMGAVIKSELITNLQIAQEAVKELGSILDELDLSSYATPVSSFSVDVAKSSNAPKQVNNQVVFESSLINIEGNVDQNVVEDLKAYGEQLTQEIIDKIYSSIR